MMAKCPECGGNMVSQMKRKICESCGLSLTISEFDRMWDKIRDEQFAEEKTHEKERRDYLKWYESKKSKNE